MLNLIFSQIKKIVGSYLRAYIRKIKKLVFYLGLMFVMLFLGIIFVISGLILFVSRYLPLDLVLVITGLIFVFLYFIFRSLFNSQLHRLYDLK